jgi:cyanophycinase
LRFFKAFEAVGLNFADAFEIIVSAENPLTIEKLSEIEPTGIFVCGGLTPAYYDALCRDKSWLEYLFENKIPYCGFSAGACVAAQKAIIGGWRREINNRIVEIANENAGEDLDLLGVRNGLNLVPFAVEVHATQWGTLSRLIHAIDAELALEGWAIDENTMLEVNENSISVQGIGNAYRIKTQKNRLEVEIFLTGNYIQSTNQFSAK